MSLRTKIDGVSSAVKGSLPLHTVLSVGVLREQNSENCDDIGGLLSSILGHKYVVIHQETNSFMITPKKHDSVISKSYGSKRGESSGLFKGKSETQYNHVHYIKVTKADGCPPIHIQPLDVKRHDVGTVITFDPAIVAGSKKQAEEERNYTFPHTKEYQFNDIKSAVIYAVKHAQSLHWFRNCREISK